MMALLNRFGSWLWTAVAAIIGVLLLSLKFLADSRQRWKERAREAEADIEFQDDVDESDAVIESATDIRALEIAKEIEEGKTVESLAEPNKWP